MMQRRGALAAEESPSGQATEEAPARESRQRTAEVPPAAEGPGLPERTADYMREVRTELQKVAWPSRPEVVNYSIVVLVVVVLITAFVFGLDYAFAKGVIFLFHK